MKHSAQRTALYVLLALSTGLVGCGASDDKGASSGNTSGNNAGDGGANNGNNGANNNGGTGGSGGTNGGSTGDASTMGCADTDGDGFGRMCELGPDCNDADPKLGGYEVCDGADNDCDGTADEFLSTVCAACDTGCTPVNQPSNVTGWVPPDQKPPEDAQDVIVDKDGALTLSRDEAQAHSVWTANTQDLQDLTNNSVPVYARGTVSKLDSKTNRELARYISVIPSFRDPVTGANVDLNATTMGGAHPLPSRSAVDQRFDSYVSNRACANNSPGCDGNSISSVGTVTKCANDVRDCIDRNLNGVIDTSKDLDADGSISLDPSRGEFLGVNDECILWTVPVGTPKVATDPVGIGSWPRALAIGVAALTPDADLEVGDVYVGLNGSSTAKHDPEICRLDARTGRTKTCVPTPNFRAYGAATGPDGRIWWVSREGTRGLGVLDNNNTWKVIDGMPQCGASNANAEPYGVAVDAKGRVYIGMSNCNSDNVFRYDDTQANPWTKIDLPGDDGTARGVAASEKHLWVAVSGNGVNDWASNGGGSDRIEQFDLATLTHVKTHRMPHGRGPVGIGVSFDGSIWAINQNHGGTNDPFTANGDVGIATRLDPTLAPDAPNHWIERAVGKHPYTYSDFIGYGLNTFADPRGYYRFVLEGCPGQDTHWRGVQVNAQTPPMTSVKINVRTANTMDMLRAAQWVGPFSGPSASFDGKVPSGDYLEVEVSLATDDQSVAPKVYGVEIIRECKTVIE